MTNGEIADALSELGTLYELDGAVRYRVLAYRDAAKVVRECPVSVAELAERSRATELAGIGETLQEKIQALLSDGEIPSAAKLKRNFPASLVEVTRVPGVGAKTARRLHEELGVAGLEDLRAAAEAGSVRELRGLGPKAEQNILAALERLGDKDPAERRLLSEVLGVAEELSELLAAHPACERVSIAGSARRRAETCKDVDLIATATEPQALASVLAESELVAASGTPSASGVKVQTHNGIPVDLRIVEPRNYGNLLQHFTGSAEHNVALRERAQRTGLSVSEHGILDTETERATACATESEVYERLGLPYIEPELREGRGELATAEAGELPRLVDESEIRGDLHMHTTLSDGRNTLEEMVAAAIELGYEYIALTDHSASHGFGDDVTPRALERRIAEIGELDSQVSELRVLAGSEVNVLPDGSLDYEDELLAELDWVIASVHTSFSGDRARMTARIEAAISHPEVDCFGHLTGRLLLRRPGYEVDVERIAAVAAREGTMLEINGNPRRRDLSEHHARLAAGAGVAVVCNTDAHGVDTLRQNMTYAVSTARRAWLTADQVANTRPWEAFSAANEADSARR